MNMVGLKIIPLLFALLCLNGLTFAQINLNEYDALTGDIPGNLEYESKILKGVMRQLVSMENNTSESNKVSVTRAHLNLIQLAKSLNLTTFVKHSLRTGLSKIINHEGFFTIFAPTNEAFTREKHYPNEGQLSEKMMFHVGRGRYEASHLTNEMILKSLLSKRTIRINSYQNGRIITANGRRIIKNDFQARNGILHVLDDVMSSVYDREGTVISELMDCCPQHSIFLELVKISKLYSFLNNPEKPMTLLAPMNSAFEKLHPDFIIHMRRNLTMLRSVIMTHVIPGTHYSAGLENGQSLKSVSGYPLLITVDSDVIKFGKASVSMADVTAGNGAIHTVDEVLFPSRFNPQIMRVSKISVVESIRSDFNNHSNYAQALDISGIEKLILKDPFKKYTIFLPSDRGFGCTLNNSMVSLKTMVQSYIVPGVKNLKRYENDQVVESLSGRFVRINRLETLDGKTKFSVNGVLVNASPKILKNGRIQIYKLRGGFSTISNLAKSTVIEELNYGNKFSKFVSYLSKYGMDVLLSSPTSSFTVLAPDNKAFDEIEQQMDPKEIASTLLANHLIPKSMYAYEMYHNGIVKSLDGKLIIVNLVYNNILLNGHISMMMDNDITAQNGVIHQVNKIIL